MHSSAPSFQKNAGGQEIDLTASFEKIQALKPVLESWKWQLRYDYLTHLGFDFRSYNVLRAVMPPGWKKVEMTPNLFSDIVDDQGAKRLNLLHDFGDARSSECSLYGIQPYFRFMLEADNERPSHCLIVDNQTNARVQLCINGEFDPLYDEAELNNALYEKEKILTGNETESLRIRASFLWDREIDLSPISLYDIYSRMLARKFTMQASKPRPSI